MKKLLLLFTLSIYQIGFSQVDLNIDKTLTIEEEVDENYTPFDYISNGVYEITQNEYKDVSYGYKVTKEKYLRKKQILEDYVKKNNYSYEVINESEIWDGDYNIVDRKGNFIRKDIDCPCEFSFIFKLKDSSGNLIITKKEAKKQLLDLKELLDLGLITQTEYDNKAQGLKKVLLN